MCPLCGENSYCDEFTNGECFCEQEYYKHEETNTCVPGELLQWLKYPELFIYIEYNQD